MRTKENAKAPEIDVLARHYLSRGLSKHADIGQHVANVDDLEKMPMWSLLTLAKKMGVDADATIRAMEEQEDQRSRYSLSNPGFKGELEFDLSISFLGQSITRKAKVVYDHTPEWEYYDLRKRALYTGWDGSSYHLEVAAVPEEHDDDGNITEGTPYWLRMDDLTKNDLLAHRMWDAILDAIDEKCKTEDAVRRKTAAATIPPRPPRGRGRRTH